MAKENEEFEKLQESILGYLDTLESTQRTEHLEDLIHRFKFELRFARLTDEERAHMLDESLSPEARAALDKEKPGSKRFDDRVQMYARSTYFRRVAWVAYLNGETKEKPFSSPAKKDEKE